MAFVFHGQTGKNLSTWTDIAPACGPFDPQFDLIQLAEQSTGDGGLLGPFCEYPAVFEKDDPLDFRRDLAGVVGE